MFFLPSWKKMAKCRPIGEPRSQKSLDDRLLVASAPPICVIDIGKHSFQSPFDVGLFARPIIRHGGC